MRSTVAVGVVAVLVWVASAAGCYEKVQRDELVENPELIGLRVRLLDISSSHLDAYGEDIRDVDALVFMPEAETVLTNIFKEVSTDPLYPKSDVDITVHVVTRRKEISATALAELTVWKGYEKTVLFKDSFRGRYKADTHESFGAAGGIVTNDTIRNNAGLEALKAAMLSLRDNPVITAYANELAGAQESGPGSEVMEEQPTDEQ